MEQQPEPAAPLRAHWTPAKQRVFLAALLDLGSVARAARAAGMSRSSAHRLRARLAGTQFDRLWDAALAEHARRLANPFDPRIDAAERAVTHAVAQARGESAAPPPPS